MRRATMAGVPARNSLSGDASRMTLNEDPRKKQRNPRDRSHQEENINAIMGFLASTDYERPFSHALLASPSLKDFQSIFRHIQSFIDPTLEFTRKFEEEVSAFLKSIKYPYVSEINRSQLIAITPHTWPVLLSMLAWLVKVVKTSCELVNAATEEDETKEIFYNFLYKEYSNYMEGLDSPDLEEAVDREIALRNQERLAVADEQKECLRKLKEEIQEEGAGGLEEVEEKLRQTEIDLQKIASLRSNQEEKCMSYKRSLEESQAMYSRLKEESRQLLQKKREMEEEIKVQPIKAEDLQEMTHERDLLIKSLEEIKRAKTILIREIDLKNQTIKAEVEETMRILSDIKKIRIGIEICINIKKTRTTTDLLEYEEYSVEGSVAKHECLAKEKLEALQKEIEMLEAALEEEKERNACLMETGAALEDEIEQKEERVKVHAQVYIEKKEATEEEYKTTVGRVDKAETELLKILAEGDNGLFQSEQALERTKIRKGRLLGKISMEEAEIQKITAIVAANVQSLKERIEEASKVLKISPP
ncbi:kinetochore protein NDC80 [Nematocida major]|uniref:kinetochore protein NDC80 n=1 Tax=Nematocida major TaxID=1912982 RepID=UPI002007D264|nr:kinetochore protein NDC80 [Nematocida major]KAH9385167.1 kinetochore protein NDC80 [Nematocida major]